MGNHNINKPVANEETSKTPIVTNHPYFLDEPVHAVLDEDTAINIHNAETNPEQAE